MSKGSWKAIDFSRKEIPTQRGKRVPRATALAVEEEPLAMQAAKQARRFQRQIKQVVPLLRGARSQEAFARDTNMRQAAIGRLESEKDRTMPRIETLLRIALAAGRDLELTFVKHDPSAEGPAFLVVTPDREDVLEVRDIVKIADDVGGAGVGTVVGVADTLPEREQALRLMVPSELKDEVTRVLDALEALRDGREDVEHVASTLQTVGQHMKTFASSAVRPSIMSAKREGG
ncbi:MAG: helix-turn-helix transcriptional regulator [Proteobacteria bacterium]|nr:helix-turn-helix transcriptional regulator [Pseudomonadota bacterium]